MSAVAIIPFYGDAIKGAYNAGKAAVKGANAAKGAMKAAKGATEVLTHLDEVRDVGKVAAGAADEVADAAKAASDVPAPRCKPDSPNCFVGGTKVMIRMPDDADLPLLDELAATGTMTAETDETAVIAVAALAVGVGVAVAKDQATRKERLKKRPLTRRNKRRGLTDGEDAEATNEVETASDDAGGMIVSEDNADAQTSNHESPAPGRRWLSGALTSLMLICFALSGWLGTQSANVTNRRIEAASRELPLTVGESHDNLGTFTSRHSKAETFTKDIENIRAGDLVLARDEHGREIGLKPVKEVYQRTSYHLRHLTFESLDGIQQTLSTTDEHPFWSVTANEFVDAGSLPVGDQVVGPSGKQQAVVASTREEFPKGVPVFNFQVEDFHTYYVSASAVSDALLVHNADHAYRVMSPEEVSAIKNGRKWADKPPWRLLVPNNCGPTRPPQEGGKNTCGAMVKRV